MAKLSPVSVTTRWWAQQHQAIADVAERHIRKGRRVITKDLFAAFDLVILCPIYKTSFLLQITSSSNHASRKKKVLACDAFDFMRENEIDVMMGVHSWRWVPSKKVYLGRCEFWDYHVPIDAPMEMRTEYDPEDEKL